MPVSRAEVEKVAGLARLRLSPAEVERLARDLAQILDHVARIRSLEVAQVEPTAHVLDLAPALRRDEPGKTLSRDEALYNAPLCQGDLFAVPRVIKDR